MIFPLSSHSVSLEKTVFCLAHQSTLVNLGFSQTYFQIDMTNADLQALYQDIVTVIESQSLTEQALLLFVLVFVFLSQTSRTFHAGEHIFSGLWIFSLMKISGYIILENYLENVWLQ